MKYLKFIILSILSGVLFGVGLFIALIYVLPIFQEFDENQFYRSELKEIENEIGMSCSDLYTNALAFAEKDIGNIINSGMNGDDWVAMVTPDQKSFIDATEKKINSCNRIVGNAEKIGLDLPITDRKAFNLLSLYSALRSFTTRYGDTPASARDLKPQALDHLMFEYQNLKD